jgi:hypothetical protein
VTTTVCSGGVLLAGWVAIGGKAAHGGEGGNGWRTVVGDVAEVEACLRVARTRAGDDLAQDGGLHKGVGKDMVSMERDFERGNAMPTPRRDCGRVVVATTRLLRLRSP